MHLASAWAKTAQRPPITVATVDHGLRANSATEAEAVAREAATLGFAARTLAWRGEKPSRAIQERARAARYGLLVACAREIGATHLVTAHTLDDQAETVLFRMARGSGLSGLRAMQATVERDGLIHARPLLEVPKAVLIEACHAGNWRTVDDPSNRNADFARTRWRQLMPSLAEEGLTAERIGVFSRRLARADDTLRQLAARVAMEASRPIVAGRCYAFPILASYGDETALRVLAEAFTSITGNPRIRLHRLETLLLDLKRSLANDKPLRRTLHHCRIMLASDALVVITPETRRARGRGVEGRGSVHPA